MFFFGVHRFSINQPIGSRAATWLAITALASQIFCTSIGIAQKPVRGQSASKTSALVEQAKKLVQNGDPQGALTLLQQAGPGSSNNSDLHAMKGICEAMLARPIESEAEFDRAIALRPNYGPTYLSSGLALASFNNLDQALDRLSTALRLDPNLPGARFNYALVLARAAKYSESEKQVDVELASKSPKIESPLDLWRLKARDAYYQKKWQETLDAYKKTLEFEPDWPEAYAAIGEALYSLNRASESLSALQRAVSLDPGNGYAYELLGKLYQDAGKQDEAIVELEAAHRLRPEDRETIYRLYRLYNSKGDAAGASRLQKELQDLLANSRAISDSDAQAALLNNTGIELEKKGDLANALDHYDRAAKADATNLIFQRNAALLLCKMGRPQEAIRRLRDILTMDSDDAETLQILAVATELASGNTANETTLPESKQSH